MKVTWKWLNDFVDLSGLKIEELIEKLGAQGLEIEEIERPSEEINNLVIGYINKIEEHPNADNLKIAYVDIKKDTLKLVTGAFNIREDVYVPVALEGAEIYGNKVKKVDLRGIESEGMICSLEELGLQDHSTGIYIFENLSEDDIGKNALEYLGLDDVIIDFEITSNRSDCLSVLGIAREISITTGREFSLPEREVEEISKKTEDTLNVEIQDEEKCYRYSARYIENIKFKDTPLWMRSRLELVGLRSINIIVDITNYVMWEIGLPLHAFDADLLDDNSIIVRQANKNEKFETLADDSLKLNESNLVIADKNKSVALAGIIGGANSEITENTKSVILEAALFDPVNIRYTAKEYKLSTDSSYRFERGMDYQIIPVASDRAAYLMAKYSDADVYKGMCDDKSEKYVPNREVSMRWHRADKLLGFEVNKEKIKEYFEKLGYKILEDKEKKVRVEVPSYRYWDVDREVDLIEEVVRLTGYDNIPMTLPRIKIKNINIDKTEHMEKNINRILHGYGLYEVYTFPFVNEEDIEILDIDKNNLYKIENPMSKELEYMSNEPLVSLLKITEKNLKRRNDLIKVFEWGRNYSKTRGENDILSVLLTGKIQKSIYNDERIIDYFDIKAIIEELISIFNFKDYKWEKNESRLWDDNLSYCFKVDEKTIMEYGKIDDSIADKYDVESQIWGLYLYIDRVLEYYSISREYKDYSLFPPVYFDLAFIVDQNIPSGEVMKLIKNKAGKDLESIRLFDVYEGKPLDKDKKSLAYSLIFRSLDKTLKEEDVNKRIDDIIKAVKKKFNAKLRD